MLFGNVSNMGARVVRMIRNFNLENRVHREISREKPRPAPRYDVTTSPPPSAGSSAAVDPAEAVHHKNDPLLALLKSVYVESTDPAPAEAAKEVQTGSGAERRPLKFHLPGSIYGLTDLVDVPVGKLTIGEALKALSSHQRQPQTWTPEKIAQDYALDLKETKSVLEFFVPFHIEIIPPKAQRAKQIKDS